MSKKTMTEKILMVLDNLIQTTGEIMYPYKGIGGKFNKPQQEISKIFYDISRSGYIVSVEANGKKYLKITSKGYLKLIKRQVLGDWDGFWRIVAFDIEETKKKTRDIFRLKLQEIGCKPIQKSVWITPNDVSKDLEKLLEILDLYDNVDYFISRALTNEQKYLKMFKLSEKDEKDSFSP